MATVQEALGNVQRELGENHQAIQDLFGAIDAAKARILEVLAQVTDPGLADQLQAVAATLDTEQQAVAAKLTEPTP